MRHLLVACSLVASASAFADYSDNKIISQGSYHQQEDELVEIFQPASSTTATTTQVESESPVTLSNQTVLQKYGSIQRDVTVQQPATQPSIYNNTTTSTTENTFSTSNSNLSWLLVHPLQKGRVSSNFGTRVMNGKREGHSGLDIAAPTGTPILATGPGQVTKAGWGTGYGQYVEIRHNGGYVTRYAHASRIHVRVGDWVNAGQHIANVGCTGRCTGPHLHYEVVKDGKRQNPSRYLAMLP